MLLCPVTLVLTETKLFKPTTNDAHVRITCYFRNDAGGSNCLRTLVAPNNSHGW